MISLNYFDIRLMQKMKIILLIENIHTKYHLFSNFIGLTNLISYLKNLNCWNCFKSLKIQMDINLYLLSLVLLASNHSKLYFNLYIMKNQSVIPILQFVHNHLIFNNVGSYLSYIIFYLLDSSKDAFNLKFFVELKGNDIYLLVNQLGFFNHKIDLDSYF
jgi:hypothetical protein